VKKLLPSIALVVVLGSGCATAPRPAMTSPANAWITPQQAVLLAANAAPDGVPGTFAMTVQATGTQNGRGFLNSELDYRDQRNLSVVLSPQAVQGLQERLGADPLVALQGKNILVTGSAARTRIAFIVDGVPTDKYYYQTHVNVTDASQLVIE